jgi:hypothetical protein
MSATTSAMANHSRRPGRDIASNAKTLLLILVVRTLIAADVQPERGDIPFYP